MNPEYTFKRLLLDNKYFFITFFIFLGAGIYYFYSYNYGTLSLWLNSCHTPFLDVFFVYMTNLGDGLFSIIVCVLLLLISFRYSLFGIISYITSGVFAQLIKHIASTPRPKMYFGDTVVLNFVSGVAIYSFNSFPSGHSATAFSLFFLLAVITKNKVLGIFYFIMALLIAMSRVYLLQHFFIDIYFGSIIGVIFTLYTIILMNKSKKISSSEFLDKSLLRLKD